MDKLTEKERLLIENIRAFHRLSRQTSALNNVGREILLNLVDRLAPKEVETSLDGKEVEIEGKKYTLKLIRRDFKIGDKVSYSPGHRPPFEGIIISMRGLSCDIEYDGGTYYSIHATHLEHAE